MNIQLLAAPFSGNPVLFAVYVVGVMVLTGALLGRLTGALLAVFGIRGAAVRADEV